MYQPKFYVEKTALDNCFWFNRIPAVLIGCTVSEIMDICPSELFEMIRNIWQPEVCVDYIDNKYVQVKCDNPFEHFDMHVRYIGGFVHYLNSHISDTDPAFLDFLDDLFDEITGSIIIAMRRKDGSLAVARTFFDKIPDGEKYRRVFFPV